MLPQLTEKLSIGIEGIDVAIAEIANKNHVRHGRIIKETGRRFSNSPWCIQLSLGSKAFYKAAIRIENRHIPISRMYRIFSIRSALGIHHEQLGADLFNIKSEVARRQLRIGEGHRNRDPIFIPYIDTPGSRIGRI